jgi:hypothetical protein
MALYDFTKDYDGAISTCTINELDNGTHTTTEEVVTEC